MSQVLFLLLKTILYKMGLKVMFTVITMSFSVLPEKRISKDSLQDHFNSYFIIVIILGSQCMLHENQYKMQPCTQWMININYLMGLIVQLRTSTSLARVSVCLGLPALKFKTNEYECFTLEQNVKIQVNQNLHSKCNGVEYILEYYFFCFD